MDVRKRLLGPVDGAEEPIHPWQDLLYGEVGIGQDEWDLEIDPTVGIALGASDE